MKKAKRTYRFVSLAMIFIMLCTLIPILNETSVNAAAEVLLSAGKMMSASSGSGTAAMANDGDGETYRDGITGTDSELLAADKQNLQVGYSENNAADNVMQNVTLPTAGINGSSISWASSMPEVITITTGSGIVVRPQDEDKEVTVTATLTLGDVTDTKQFSLTVKKQIQGEKTLELISGGKPAKASYSTYPKDFGPEKVNDGILNGDIINGVPVENYWDSIRGAGGLAWVRIDLLSTFTIKSINVAPYYDGNRYYNYFIEVSEDGENWARVGEKSDTSPSPRLGDTYEFTDKILARYVRVSMTKNSVDNYSVHISEIKVYGYKDDADAVAEDKAALEIGYEAGENAQSVTKNINLTSVVNCGSEIIWNSSNSSVIDNTGHVNRPYDTDVQVTLTATIKKGSVSDTKSFVINVKHQIPISINMPVTASSTEPGNPAANAVDDNDGTYWAGYIDGTSKVASLAVDLLNVYDLTSINVRPYSDGVRYYNYYVEGSTDGNTWVQLCANNSAAPAAEKGDYYYVSAKARYIRLNVTKFYTGSGFDYMAHVKEIKIYGNKTDDMSVADDKNALKLQYAQGDSADNVRMNVSLPAQGSNGSIISWQSSNPSIISNNGQINTSEMPQQSMGATLTATIAKGSVSDTKLFDVTIVKPISQGKPVTASSSVTGHGPELVNDGNPSTYLDSFRSSDGNAICQIDLQENYKLNGINIANFADGTRYYKYFAKISTDGINWIPVLSKNDEVLSTSDGCYYNVKGVARYIRIYTTYNSVSEDEIHICEVRVFGEKVQDELIPPVGINSFETDKNAYMAGDTAKADLTITNTTNDAVAINSIKLKVAGLTNPLYYREYMLEQDVAINPGQNFSIQNKDFWNIAQEKNLLGAYGLWVAIEFADGSAYDKYCGFIRVIDDKTLLNYDVKKFDYNGLNVYALDGGMSAEACVEKSLESLGSTVSHSWYVQSNGGPDFVYASSNFLADSIEKTVNLYNQNLGANTQFDTVILATGNCGVNYLSTITKAPVLPVQFLVTADTYKELRGVIDTANNAGIPCYSTLGHDLSMKKGVAWVKLMDLPQVYKDFLIQHKVKNIIIAATENSGGGESRAKKAVEPGTDLSQTKAGDIFVMYPNGYTQAGLELDEKELASCIRDYKELNLEQDFRDFSDWESGMIQPQVDNMALSAKNAIGSNAEVMQIAADGAKALYDYATCAVAKFYDKNRTNYSGDAIKGIVINPYLIGHPAYEIYNGYLPVMLWQGNTNGNAIVNNLVNVIGKEAVEKYFPNIDFDTGLKFWIDYTNNFGGEFQAQEIKTALLQNGIAQAQIVENIYTRDEIWNPEDGMEAPVEQIAQAILQNNIKQDMKSKYGLLMPLSIDELTAVAAGCTQIRTAVLSKPTAGGDATPTNSSNSSNQSQNTASTTIILKKEDINKTLQSFKGERLSLNIGDSKPADNLEVLLPPLDWKQLKNKIKDVVISFGEASISISSDLLGEYENRDIRFRVSRIIPKAGQNFPEYALILNFELFGNNNYINNLGSRNVQVKINFPLDNGQDAGKLVASSIKDDGTCEVVQNCRYDTDKKCIVFYPSHFSKYGIIYSDKSFKDIGEFPWAKQSIEALAARELLTEHGIQRFHPGAFITKEEFVAMLIKALELEAAREKTLSFKDVNKDSKFYKYIDSAVQRGIVAGKSSNFFGIGESLSRQDMAVIAYKALLAKGYKLQNGIGAINLKDGGEISNYAAEAVNSLINNNILSGTGNGRYSPKQSLSRAEAAVVIYKLQTLCNFNN